MKKRLLSLLLCCTMLFSLCPQVVSAEGVQDRGKTIGGLCEHHPEHTAECGYTEGTPGTDCTHEHTEDCYTLVTECVHEHDEDCYPAESVSENTATPSDADKAEPTECGHECSEESDCITKELDCKHEHDSECGYALATEGTPCGYICEICNPQDSGTNPADPEEKPETECTCETLCTAEEANADCPVCGAEGVDLTLCNGAEPETATPSEAEKSPVGEVQKLIDALPTLEDLQAMTEDGQNAVYTELQAAYDAYEALTDEQKAEVTGAEIFESLFAFFNGKVNVLADGSITEAGITIAYSNGGSATYSAGNGFQITAGGDYTISGLWNGSITGAGSLGNQKYVITVSGNITANVTMQGLTIDVSGTDYVGAFMIKDNATVNLTLSGENSLNSGKKTAGLGVSAGTNLVIKGTGSLMAACPNGFGAGIGVGDMPGGSDSGDITLNGGTITAIGGLRYPGIGTGLWEGSSSSSVTIKGGTVTAIGGDGAAGIGHAAAMGGEPSCAVTISGGTVTAIGGGALIGGSVANGIDDRSKQSEWNGSILVIGRDDSGIYGGDSFTLQEDFEISSGKTLNIESGKTLNVSNGVTLTNNGSITGYGTLDGDGDLKGSGTIADTIANNLRKESEVEVSISPSSATYGSNVTITATISKTVNTFAAASNQVEFFVGTGGDKKSLGTANVSGTTATLSNVAVSNEKGFTVGENTITAEYGGSMGLKPKIGTVTLTVNLIPLSEPGNLTFDSSTPGEATATWDAVENASGYSVQLYKDDQPQGSPVSVNNDTAYTFENITEAGSYIVKVKATGTGYYADGGETESNSLTFYKVTFELNDGSGSIEPQIVASGGRVNQPTAPTKTGYTFEGWYSDSGFNTSYDFDNNTISEPTTIYAKWTAIIYNVTVTVEGGTSNTASASPASATIGTQVTLTAAPAEGYHFVEWQVVSGGVTISEQNTFTMPAGNVEVKAVFAKHQFSNWKANGSDTHTGICSCGETKTEDCSYTDGACSVCGYVDVAITTHPESAIVKEGQTATFTVAAKGEDISYQWQVKAGNADWADISGATASSYTTSAAAMTMDGYQYRCTVSNTTGDSATSSAATLTVKKGASHIDPAYIGYFVEHYQKDPVSGRYELADREYLVDEISETVTATQKNYTGYTCNTNAAGTITSGTLTEIKDEKDIVVLKLYYDPNTYDVTLNAGNGVIAAGKDVTEYIYGVGAALPTAEDVTCSGYVFKGWYEDSGFSGDPVTEISDTNTGAKTYYAKWVKLWTVTVNTEGAGTVSGGGTFENSSTVTVTATPNGSRDYFIRWTENGTEVSRDAAYSFVLTADRNLIAEFGTHSSSEGGSSTTYYTLTFDTNGGSKIDPFRTSSYGKTVDLSGYKPTREGYDFNGWYSDAGLTNRITEIRLNGNKTVYAGWTKRNPGTGVDNPFTDVKESDWFYNDVMFVYGNGLMSGTTATTFEPYSNTTRAQLAVIFYRMAGSPAVTGDSPFTDVEYGPGTAWYYNAVLWAHQNGIVAGYGDGTYHPGDPVTREQLAVMFYNYANYKGYDLSAAGDLSVFTDAGNVSDWARDAMKWAVGSGLMNGKGDGILDPKGAAARAEVAAMLHNFIDRNHLVPPAAPGGDSGTGGTGGSGGGGWTQRIPNPQTGDSTHIGLWASLTLASLSALIILVVIQRRKPEDEETFPQLV